MGYGRRAWLLAGGVVALAVVPIEVVDRMRTPSYRL